MTRRLHLAVGRPALGDSAANDGANGGDDGGGDASCPAPAADPAFLSDAVEIDTSGHFVCAVRASGQVVCWGENLNAQLGINPPVDGGAPDAGTAFSSRGIVVPGVTGATHVAAGYQHACAVVAGGGVWCWGANTVGQLGDGTTTSRNLPVRVLAPL